MHKQDRPLRIPIETGANFYYETIKYVRIRVFPGSLALARFDLQPKFYRIETEKEWAGSYAVISRLAFYIKKFRRFMTRSFFPLCAVVAREEKNEAMEALEPARGR